MRTVQKVNDTMLVEYVSKVSVIIPVYNGVKYIAETINGIRLQEKDGIVLEIIVIDDASTDNGCEIAQSLGCRVFRNITNCGQVAGRAKGIGLARNEFIIFNDQDDVMKQGTLKKLLFEWEIVGTG